MGESSKTPLMNQHQPHQPSPSKERAEYAELMFKVGFNLLPNLDHAGPLCQDIHCSSSIT